MRVSPDPRAARTRQSILNAVHVLAGEVKESITVGDIVAQAGISRSAFYTQFASLDELAQSVLSEALDQIGAEDVADDVSGPSPQRTAGGDAARRGMTALVRHIDGHRALYASVLRLPFSYLAYAQLVDALAVHIAASIDPDGLTTSPRSVWATSAYVAGGTLAVLRLWLQGDLAGTAEEIVEDLLALRSPGLATRP